MRLIVGWIGVPISIVALVAVVGWLLAAISAFQIFSLVPQGQRMAGYSDLSMWRFDKLRQRTGPVAEPLIKRMKLGGIVFAAAIVLLLVVVAISIPFNQAAVIAAAALSTGPINGVSDA